MSRVAAVFLDLRTMAYLLLLPSCLLPLCFIGAFAFPDNNLLRMPIPTSSSKLSLQFRVVLSSLGQIYLDIYQGKLGVVAMVSLAALCGVLPGFWWLRRKRKARKSLSSSSTEDSHSEEKLEAVNGDIDTNGRLSAQPRDHY